MLCHIKFRVNFFGDRFNVSPQFLLNALEIVTILISNEVNCDSEMSKSARTEKQVKVKKYYFFSVISKYPCQKDNKSNRPIL